MAMPNVPIHLTKVKGEGHNDFVIFIKKSTVYYSALRKVDRAISPWTVSYYSVKT
jgi:hypothetical protein